MYGINHNSFDTCNPAIDMDIRHNHFDLNNSVVRIVVTCDEILGMRSLKYWLTIFSTYSFIPLDVIQYFSKFRLTDSILSLELISSPFEIIPATLDTRNASITIIHFITLILFFSQWMIVKVQKEAWTSLEWSQNDLFKEP